MRALWKISSGNFAGWRAGDSLYDADGDSVGFFNGDIAYSNDGDYIGELYNQDTIGKRSNVARPSRMGRIPHIGRTPLPHIDRWGLAILGWDDPAF